MLARKCCFVGILVLLSLGMAIAAPPAVHPSTGQPLVITCLRGTPEAIDGDLSDWNLAALTPAVVDAPAQVYTGQASWTGPADCSGQFYLLWDDQKIYIAAIIKDDALSMTKTAGNIWNADCIEIFFGTTNALTGHTEHYQWGLNANNQTWCWDNMDGGAGSPPAYLQVVSTRTPDGYICEAAMDYSGIRAIKIAAGSTIGFHPCIDDTEATDREVQITWTGREAHDQSLGFGHLTFSDTQVSGGGDPLARSPKPKDGDLIDQTWTEISWRPGHYAVSHNLYMGDNFNDVNTGAASTFKGNMMLTSLYVGLGLPGDPIPSGLLPGTTYYWRVDEVNDANAASPWKGDVWSFSVKPYTAYSPSPANAAEAVVLNTKLTWTAGFGAKLHTVYIGEDLDTVSNATTGGAMAGTTSYTPTSLKAGKTYYWRVDETNPPTTYKGQVWSFTTVGGVSKAYPSNGNPSVEINPILTWTPGTVAASHQVYFGTDKDAVRKAGTTSPEYKGTRALGAESYDPGMLAKTSAYYWRVDEVNSVNSNSPWKGPVWSFTTGDFLLLDGFESYNDNDTGNNRIFDKWLDGYGTTNNGALVGNNLPPYAERTVVHSGVQSMPYTYDNNLKYSEATLTLSGTARDWTREGVTSLSLWFRGTVTNAADKMYVVLNGTAVVYHNDPSVTQKTAWTRWTIPLQQFTGVPLNNVTSIAIGFGTRNNTTVAGGAGKMHIDDIQLVP